ncbi:MAG TPA: glycosyltransferase family 39 protein [Caulobacteraceae bacterium]
MVDQWDGWTRRWRGPLFAALVAMVAGLPGVFALPPLDRDESRFAQATTQMFEQGDYININFQDEPRHKKPVGIHWMQAVSVELFSEPEEREIWTYRIPSLLGAMLAAAACAWGAAAFFGSGIGFVSGAVLGASVLLSTEANIAKTDAVLCGAITLAMAALGRLYARNQEGIRTERATRALFWLGISLSILVKGPIGPMIAGLALLTLWAWDRNLRWLKGIGWWWGLVAVLAMVGPWALAITIVTDGAFWGTALGGDLAPKIAGGHETHGAPPGTHTLLAPLMLFPATLLVPAALVLAWRKRREPGVRFAIAWVLPSWTVFELLPTKLVHYPLPLYGGIAWLIGAALWDRKALWARWAGAALSVLAGVAFAGAAFYAVSEYGDPGDTTWAALGAGLALAAGVAGAVALMERSSRAALALAGGLGVAAHGVIVAGLLPSLEPLWLSQRTAQALSRAGLNPRDGVAPGPVEVSGYAEPSLVFALGTGTGTGSAEDAARAVAEGRPAVVERADEADFLAAAERLGVNVQEVAEVEGLNYSKGDDTVLVIYRFAPPRPEAGR